MRIKLLAIAAAVAAFSANAAIEDTYSFGVGAGWTHAFGHNLSRDIFSIDREDGYQASLNGEYNFTNWFGIGAAYDYQNDILLKKDGREDSFKLHTNSADLYTRFAYPLDNNGSDLFFKAGAAYVASSFDGDTHKRFAPVAGIGIQYALNKSLAVRAGYDYKWHATKLESGKVNTGTLYLGVQFTFGAPEAPVVAPAKQTVHVTKKHTLEAGLLFPFDGAVLSAEGKEAVATVVSSTKDLENAEYEVYGYTDRIGSDAYNQKLSAKRANAVAQELSADGITTIKTVEGRGKAEPVTGDKCDSVKGRDAVINCLAPDRRVEIVVNGDTVTSQVE
jgi:OOP family OmpA-OmpF porin